MLHSQNPPIEGSDPRAEELRTLGLKNTDNKAITGANIKQFDIAVSLHAVSLQRGFVSGRQLVLNIPDLDAICRAQANLNYFPFESILALWDFMAAFPSVIHDWIHLVLVCYGFPRSFRNFIRLSFFIIMPFSPPRAIGF